MASFDGVPLGRGPSPLSVDHETPGHRARLSRSSLGPLGVIERVSSISGPFESSAEPRRKHGPVNTEGGASVMSPNAIRFRGLLSISLLGVLGEYRL